MRSLFIDKEFHDLSESQSEVVIDEKDKLHHLNNVLRMKEGAAVLLFNQDGFYCSSELKQLTKKKAVFHISQHTYYKRPHLVELALCWLKKDALEDAITNAIQMGVSKIHLLRSEYSQTPTDLNKSRFKKLLTSAMEQSNHFLWPEIFEYSSIDEFMKSNSGIDKYGFTLSDNIATAEVSTKLGQSCIYFIGPEGGLSQNEIKELEMKNMKFFHLPLPIMRAPVAVSCALGYIVAQIK